MVNDFLKQSFLGNQVLDYLIFIGLFLLGVLFLKLFVKAFIVKVKKWTKNTKSNLDDFLIMVFEKIIMPALYFGIFYLSVNFLKLDETLEKALAILATAVITVVVARVVVSLVRYGFKVYLQRRGDDTAMEKSLKGILNLTKFLIWGIAVLFFLDNLGFEVSTVIAGLGIGGVAVALAAQAVLGDLFSYFAILFDRPFQVGDFIIIGDYLGSIEKIGIKTTHIRSLGGEQLVFSNTDLTNSRIRNYKRMEKRRVLFKLGVIYQTESEKLKEIPKIIENIIKSVNDTVFDRAHFYSYGDFSLNFEVVYYVIGSDYNKYMDIQQQMNLKIKEEFESRNIEFAYPTQTLFVEKN